MECHNRDQDEEQEQEQQHLVTARQEAALYKYVPRVSLAAN